jgi:hypothetical protein
MSTITAAKEILKLKEQEQPVNDGSVFLELYLKLLRPALFFKKQV